MSKPIPADVPGIAKKAQVVFSTLRLFLAFRYAVQNLAPDAYWDNTPSQSQHQAKSVSHYSVEERRVSRVVASMGRNLTAIPTSRRGPNDRFQKSSTRRKRFSPQGSLPLFHEWRVRNNLDCMARMIKE